MAHTYQCPPGCTEHRGPWPRETAVAEMYRRIQAVVITLRAQGIHVGIGTGSGPARCVTCDSPWPCNVVRRREGG